jgi:hypothetical protein
MRKTFVTLLRIAAILLTAGAAFIGGRYALAAARIARNADTGSQQTIQGLGSTRTLTILPLFDAAAARDELQPGGGVSYLIQHRHRITLQTITSQMIAGPPDIQVGRACFRGIPEYRANDLLASS